MDLSQESHLLGNRSPRNRCKSSIKIFIELCGCLHLSYRTKAERRELQEKQRAAKAAKAATAGPNGKPGGKPTKEPPPPIGVPSRKTGRSSDAASRLPSAGLVKAAQAKAGQSSLADQGVRDQARGLLIFSHFGLPKPVSAAKGDIHPVIARLALQFSTFKITGANARCIATLTAFKTVCTHLSSFFSQVSHTSSGHSRLCYTAQQHALSPSHDIPLASNQPFSRCPTDVCYDGQCHPSTETRY